MKLTLLVTDSTMLCLQIEMELNLNKSHSFLTDHLLSDIHDKPIVFLLLFQGCNSTSAGSDRSPGNCTENDRITAEHRWLGGQRYLAEL